METYLDASIKKSNCAGTSSGESHNLVLSEKGVEIFLEISCSIPRVFCLSLSIPDQASHFMILGDGQPIFSSIPAKSYLDSISSAHAMSVSVFPQKICMMVS